MRSCSVATAAAALASFSSAAYSRTKFSQLFRLGVRLHASARRSAKDPSARNRLARPRLGQSPRPQPVDEHPCSVACGGRLVDAFELYLVHGDGISNLYSRHNSAIDMLSPQSRAEDGRRRRGAARPAMSEGPPFSVAPKTASFVLMPTEVRLGAPFPCVRMDLDAGARGISVHLVRMPAVAVGVAHDGRIARLRHEQKAGCRHARGCDYVPYVDRVVSSETPSWNSGAAGEFHRRQTGCRFRL